MAGHTRLPRIDWVVAGAESGQNRRAFDVAWALDLYKQCRDAKIAFFGKQDSSLYPGRPLLLPGILGEVHEWPLVKRGSDEQRE